MRRQTDIVHVAESCERLTPSISKFWGDAMTTDSQFTVTLGQITHQPADAEVLDRWSRAPKGIVLFAGRPGSGKTTTVYACLAHAVQHGAQGVATLEQEIDMSIPGVAQTQAPEGGSEAALAAMQTIFDGGATVLFADATAAAWGAAIRYAEAGRLVFVQLEADSAADAIERFTASTSAAATSQIVGSIWQTLTTLPESNRRRADYEFAPGPLGS